MLTGVMHQISIVEERLRLAMLASDVDTLDELMSPDLIFTNLLGRCLVSKMTWSRIGMACFECTSLNHPRYGWTQARSLRWSRCA
jgi:hypothetical protein